MPEQTTPEECGDITHHGYNTPYCRICFPTPTPETEE